MNNKFKKELELYLEQHPDKGFWGYIMNGLDEKEISTVEINEVLINARDMFVNNGIKDEFGRGLVSGIEFARATLLNVEPKFFKKELENE